MKNYQKILLLGLIFSAASVECAKAGKLSVINKIPDQRIQLFIRGEGNKEHNVSLIEAGQQKDMIIEKEHVGGRPTFEVIASTGNGGDPDWKLMGGACTELVTGADHTLVIDSTLGKTTCTNITAKNPPAAQY